MRSTDNQAEKNRHESVEKAIISQSKVKESLLLTARWALTCLLLRRRLWSCRRLDDPPKKLERHFHTTVKAPVFPWESNSSDTGSNHQYHRLLKETNLPDV